MQRSAKIFVLSAGKCPAFESVVMKRTGKTIRRRQSGAPEIVLYLGRAKYFQGKAAGIKRNAARSGRSIHRICGGKARYSFFRMTMYSLCIVFMLAPFLFEGLVALGIRLPVIDRT